MCDYDNLEGVVSRDLPDKINVPGLMRTVDKLKKKGIRLADKNLDSDKIEGIELVIGADYYGSFINDLTIKEDVNLCQSSGGHLIYGQISSEGMSDVRNAIVARICTDMTATELSPMLLT